MQYLVLVRSLSFVTIMEIIIIIPKQYIVFIHYVCPVLSYWTATFHILVNYRQDRLSIK